MIMHDHVMHREGWRQPGLPGNDSETKIEFCKPWNPSQTSTFQGSINEAEMGINCSKWM